MDAVVVIVFATIVMVSLIACIGIAMLIEAQANPEPPAAEPALRGEMTEIAEDQLA